MNLSKLTLKALSHDFIRVSGSDAERFLNGMWTADIKGASRHLPRMSGGAAFLLSVKGKIVNEATFVCQNAQEFLFSMEKSHFQDAVDALERLLVADDVVIEPLLADKTLFDRVYDVPESPLALADVGGDRVKPLVPEAKDRVFFVHQESWGLRIGKGLLGPRHEEWWVYKNSTLPFSFEGISDSAWKSLRIQQAVPEWQKDYTSESLPLEFPLLHAISYHKGCYIGQEVIAVSTYRGQMTRAWVRVLASGDLEENALLYSKAEPEKAVGKLSTCVGPKGLGLLRVAVLKAGTPLFQRKADGSTVEITQVEDFSQSIQEKTK